MTYLKKTVLTLFTLTATLGFSQGLYIDAGVGYSLPFNASTEIISSSDFTSMYNFDLGESSYSDVNKNVPLSLGKGFNAGASVGYMFNKFVGAELQLNYLIGASTSAESSYTDTDIDNGMTTSYTEKYTTSLSSNMFRATPTLVVKTGFDKINPYAKLGVVLGFGSTTIEQESTGTGFDQTMKMEYTGGVAIGLNASVGVLFETEGMVSYFVEVNSVNMNHSYTTGEITEYKVNGMDELGSLSTSDKEVVFSDETTYSSDEEPNENEPSQALKTSLPFGSIGLNAGVRFNLGK
jgi:hypothetical protein